MRIARRTRRRRARPLELSSAHRILRGTSYGGRKIQRVLKLGGARRQIVVRGGPPVTVNRSTIHELAKAAGWIEYHRRLKDAPTLSAKKAIVRASRKRQRGILLNTLRRYREGAKVAPPHVRREIQLRIRRLKRMKWGSPILGHTPVTSAVPPHHGPAHTFSVLARAGIPYRTVKRGRRVRVLPKL